MESIKARLVINFTNNLLQLLSQFPCKELRSCSIYFRMKKLLIKCCEIDTSAHSFKTFRCLFKFMKLLTIYYKIEPRKEANLVISTLSISSVSSLIPVKRLIPTSGRVYTAILMLRRWSTRVAKRLMKNIWKKSSLVSTALKKLLNNMLFCKTCQTLKCNFL